MLGRTCDPDSDLGCDRLAKMYSYCTVSMLLRVSFVLKTPRPDMYNFFEKGIRGGLSVQVNRFSKANHLHLKSHNPDELTKYILYTDANNLYGYAMKQSLPYKHFEWEEEKTTEQWVNRVKHMHEFENEWLERQNEAFREKHNETRFPEDWGSHWDRPEKISPVADMRGIRCFHCCGIAHHSGWHSALRVLRHSRHYTRPSVV